MPVIHKGRVYWPLDEPSVAYDRKGAAYVAGFYGLSGFDSHDFVAVQKSTDGARLSEAVNAFLAVQTSTDGVHWSKPVAALGQPGSTFPFDTWLTADTNAGSTWVNSVYASGIMWSRQGSDNQVMVSHSRDGGDTWTQIAVNAVQKYPAEDRYARMAVGKDGTVYVTWMHCTHAGPDASCSDDVGHMMFSKSTDGGSTWSSPHLTIKVVIASDGLPNTGQRVYDTPVIGVDNSSGTYSGNLYVAMYTWTGAYLRVQVIRSADGGNTWSQPVPLAPKSATHDQFFPSISVSSTGQVGVSWLDRRNDPANIDYQAFAAISDDGGKTFHKNWQLTQAFSNPNTNGTGNNWMGDYTGNTWAGPDFIAAWMDSSNGVDMQEVVGGIRLK